MKIKSAVYVMSEVALERFPKDNLFEIVLVGKSNVGKSSFINAMVNKNGLARTSSQPGKTRTANFYLVNEEFYFVDMPGYGYAKVSKNLRNEFDKIIRLYLQNRQTDFIVFFLVDFRHAPTEADIAMFQNILSCDILPILILTKTDKVKNSQKAANLKVIQKAFDLDEDDAVFPFSVNDKNEIERVWNFIGELLNGIK